MGSIRGSSYYTTVDGPTWTQAETNAAALGGHLVAINDSNEQNWINQNLPNENLWIGLYDPSNTGKWQWTTGEQYDYSNWYPNEPSRGGEQYVLLYRDNRQWNDGWDKDHGTWLKRGIAEIPLSYFSVSDLTLTEGSSGTVTITRTGGTGSTQNLTLTSSNGTATAGSDYTAFTTTVSFAAGETSKTVSISTIDDSSVESGESFNLTLSASSTDAVPAQISDGTAIVTITDNDTAATRSTFSIDSTNVWEGDTASLSITRSGGLSNVITLNVTTANGTAKAGSDYTALNSTITFQAGESAKTISIATKQDSAKESDEAFTVSINSSDPLAQFNTSTGTVTIEDDDSEQGSTNTVTNNGNNNNTVIGNGNTVNNNTVINNTTNVITTNTTNTNNTTNNVTNNTTTNTTNIIGTVSIDLSNLLQGTSSRTDLVTGTESADVIGAGKGTDKLTGGNDADQFVFNTRDRFGKKGADTITDFNPEQGDKLILSPDALPGLSNPELTTVTSKKALKAAQKSAATLIYYEPLGQLFYDQNGSGRGFGKGGLFAVLSGAPVLSADDLGLLG